MLAGMLGSTSLLMSLPLTLVPAAAAPLSSSLCRRRCRRSTGGARRGTVAPAAGPVMLGAAVLMQTRAGELHQVARSSTPAAADATCERHAGECLQTVDMNQENRLAEAFKVLDAPVDQLRSCLNSISCVDGASPNRVVHATYHK